MMLIRSIHKFVDETESMCGRQMHSLSGTMMAQVRKLGLRVLYTVHLFIL